MSESCLKASLLYVEESKTTTVPPLFELRMVMLLSSLKTFNASISSNVPIGLWYRLMTSTKICPHAIFTNLHVGTHMCGYLAHLTYHIQLVYPVPTLYAL